MDKVFFMMKIIKYEGEWKDGKANGHGIEYYENGNKCLEGEWKDGELNGQGILYYENGNKRYKGECKDSKPHGQGIEYNEDEEKINEGEFVDGVFVENNSNIILVLQSAYDYNRALMKVVMKDCLKFLDNLIIV